MVVVVGWFAIANSVRHSMDLFNVVVLIFIWHSRRRNRHIVKGCCIYRANHSTQSLLSVGLLLPSTWWSSSSPSLLSSSSFICTYSVWKCTFLDVIWLLVLRMHCDARCNGVSVAASAATGPLHTRCNQWTWTCTSVKNGNVEIGLWPR